MEIKLTRWFIYEWGKPTRQKPYGVILRSPLSRIYYYQNKRLQVNESQYLIPTNNWTLTPILNWTCFVVTISHFQCTAPSTWLTNCVDPNMQLGKILSLVTKPYGVQTQKLLQEKDELGKILSLVKICINKTLLHTCATVQLVTTLKIILIYV